MINKELREFIAEINEDVILFDNPSFDNSIIGTTQDGIVIYDYDLMVEELMKDDNIEDQTESMEFIDYNTLRAIPYAGSNAPIVLMNKEQIDFIKNS